MLRKQQADQPTSRNPDGEMRRQKAGPSSPDDGPTLNRRIALRRQ